MKLIVVIIVIILAPLHSFANKWNELSELSVTRCFKTTNIKVWCDDFSYNENGQIFHLKELQIEAKDYFGKLQSYGYGKALDGSLCQSHLKKIRKLTNKTDLACITGEGENKIGPNEIYYRWRDFETKHGRVAW